MFLKCVFVHRTDVTNNKTNEHQYYSSIPETPFKERFENHKTSFRHRSHLTTSDLSKYYWKLVENSAVPTIKFSIAKSVKRNASISNCKLRLSEKVFIIRNLDGVNVLNKRSEFISKSRNINKRLFDRVRDYSND